MDDDQPGREGVEKFAHKLGIRRTFLVTPLPNVGSSSSSGGGGSSSGVVVVVVVVVERMMTFYYGDQEDY